MTMKYGLLELNYGVDILFRKCAHQMDTWKKVFILNAVAKQVALR
jgi:hypothetical protein